MVDSTVQAGLAVRDLRLTIGWSQRTLAAKAGVSQGVDQRNRARSLSGRLDRDHRPAALRDGAQLVLDVKAPFLGRDRQRDVVHARCTSYVARRLERLGWDVATEVEVGGDRSRGWIDVLACHPSSGLTLVIEIKTELRDLGAIERALGWYEREAWAAARRLGWRPRRVVGCLVLLSTEAVEQRIRENRVSIDRGFPIRARGLSVAVDLGDAVDVGRGRAMALIDPRSRRRNWLRPSRIDGGRTRAPYADYADFVRLDRVS